MAIDDVEINWFAVAVIVVGTVACAIAGAILR